MSDFSLVFACTAMTALVAAGVLPFLALFRGLREKFATAKFWAVVGASTLGSGVALAGLLDANQVPALLSNWGRIIASVATLELGLAFLIGTLFLLLKLWPKGGAVALAAFQEGVRQPLFWFLWGFAFLLISATPFIPYFTFGEDLKMVKQICFALAMLAPAAFGVIAASISVSEEIEGRTAVTLLSKPVSRRQFLLGKYAGILLAALSMTITLGWWLVWIVLYKHSWEARLPASMMEVRPDPVWPQQVATDWFGPGNASEFGKGVLLWVAEFGEALPSLVIGFCLVMVLLSVAVALGTRLPMVVNIPACVILFFLGNLAPILREVTRDEYRLISFVAGLFQTILPALDLFDVASANIRDLPLPLWDYTVYTFNAFLYAATFSGIALLFGLILFEDRDVA